MDFRQKFNIEELTIYRSKYWTWSIRPTQITLASSIISSNTSHHSFCDLNEAEACDYIKTIALLENSLKNLFHINKFNYLTLMMVDQHLHTHVIPRHIEHLQFLGESYEDIYWPNPVDITSQCIVEEKKTLIALKKYIQEHLVLTNSL